MTRQKTALRTVLNSLTPEDLEAQGYTVKFRHQRNWKPILRPEPSVLASLGEMKWREANEAGFFARNEPVQYELDSNGGKTVCQILRDGDVVAMGEARVSPKDVYNKKLGRIKAFGIASGTLRKSLTPHAQVLLAARGTVVDD